MKNGKSIENGIFNLREIFEYSIILYRFYFFYFYQIQIAKIDINIKFNGIN